MLIRARRGLIILLLALLVLTVGHSEFRLSPLDMTVAPYRYSLAGWEVTNFLDKWVHKLGNLMPWASEPPREVRIEQVTEYFNLGQRLRDLERQLLFPDDASSRTLTQEQSNSLRAQIEAIHQRRGHLKAGVEETIESEISAVLTQLGFSSRIGLIFPPVDTVFSRSPGVLILSPRDRIHRQQTILMKAGLSDETREQIEGRIFQEENLAALVESSGGVAAYPSVVSESGGLRHAVVTAAHEWLHHWFFFQPLGQHYWDNSQMITLNETAATLGGQSIGDQAYTAMTGEVVTREPPEPPKLDPDKDVFDFSTAMRETRVRTDELLAEGMIVAAEAYMEERRQLMVDNGFFIRKINQAFFAFRGSYATSAASISPIDEQLRTLQSRSDSLEDFVKTVAQFSSYQEFLEHLEVPRVHVQGR